MIDPITTDNPQHFAVRPGSYSNAFPVAEKRIQFAGQTFVMVQTSRIYHGWFGWVQKPYRIELYRVDPDGLETFVSFLDPEGSMGDDI